MNLQARARQALSARSLDVAQETLAQAVVAIAPNELMQQLNALPSTNSGPDWMRTFLAIGGLDLAGDLEVAQTKTPKFSPFDAGNHALKACEEWACVASAFLGVMGSGNVNRKDHPKATWNASTPATAAAEFPDRRPPRVTWNLRPGAMEAFEKGTRFIAGQAQAVRATPSLKDAAAWPKIDSREAQTHKAVQVLSTWAGMACFLDRPDLLRLVIDAHPEAMSTAIPLSASRNMQSLVMPNGKETFGTMSTAEQRVSPMLCAMHASSKACIDVLYAKRREMGLYIDPRLFSWSGPGPFSTTLTQKANAIGSAASPEMVLYALDPVMNALPTTRSIVGHKLALAGKDQAELFCACARQGLFHNNGYGVYKDALQMALDWIPQAMPDMLQGIHWEQLHGSMKSLFSPLLKTLVDADSQPGLRERRDASLAMLVRQAHAEGQGDWFSKNYLCLVPSMKCTVEVPAANLSEAGFTRVVMALMDHGFQPNQKPEGADVSVIELAMKDHHPTLPAMRSHLARSKANKLLDEMDESPTLPRP